MKRYQDFPELIAALALQRDAPALTFYEGRALRGSLTYGELAARVEAVAGALVTTYGVVRGDRVAILAPNRLEVPVLMLALMRLGAAAVPLNPTGAAEDWTYIVGHSNARGCFATRELLDRVTGLDFVKPIDELAGYAGAAPALADTGADAAVVLYTSGTTGRPKGVVLPQRALLANAWSMAENFELGGVTQFAVLPLYHAHAFGFGLMSALTTGGHLVFNDRFDPFAWPEIIRAHDVTITSVVPTLLPPLLQVRIMRDKVPTLRAIMVSSAPLGVDLARQFEDKVGVPLVQGWGLSEYTNFACCMPPPWLIDRATRDALTFSPEVPSIGTPLNGTEVRVLGPAGEVLGAGARGELAVRGHSTMLSYLHDAAATAAVLDADGWLRTGDEGYFLDVAGAPRFFISGRIKEIIIRGGEKHSPIALERTILAALPELLGKLAILGFPHTAHGEEIGAYIEADAFTDDIAARLPAVLDAMSADQRPKIVLHGAEPIPRTHTGKVQRRKLLHLFEPHASCRGATKILATG